MRLAVLITSHNRRELTLRCLRSLFESALPRGLTLEVFLVDDGSRDGTNEEVAAQFPAVHRIMGSGDLYWAGGMSLAWTEAAKTDPDAYLWLNDDVVLKPGAVSILAGVAVRHPRAVIVGSCEDPGRPVRTYGGLRRAGLHPGKIAPLDPGSHLVRCDTFEGNLVWVPRVVFRTIGGLGPYRHAMADIDYGYRVAAADFSALLAPGFLGACAGNSLRGTWQDPAVPIRQRLAKLRQMKGLPPRDWWRFCRTNGGVLAPFYFISPVLRVLAGPLLKRAL